MTPATPVILAASSAPPHQLDASWQMSFDEALAHLRTQIRAVDLVELGLIDTTAILRGAALQIPEIRQIVAFHPRYMRILLETDPAAAVEAPLKITLIERGDTVEVRCPDPAASFAPYPHLKALAAELHSIARTLLLP